MSYSGKFNPTNPTKYAGDIKTIRWLSLWERGVMRWLDKNKDVVKWGSEIIQIRYICETDQKSHLYLVDFYIEFKDGRRLMVEVKPAYQTVPPKTDASKTKTGKTRSRYLKEAKTYIKNASKWKAAAAFAKKNGLEFQIWTEHHLRNNLGLRVQ